MSKLKEQLEQQLKVVSSQVEHVQRDVDYHKGLATIKGDVLAKKLEYKAELGNGVGYDCYGPFTEVIKEPDV